MDRRTPRKVAQTASLSLCVVCLLFWLPICFSASLFVYPSVCLPCLLFHLSVCLPLCLSLCLSEPLYVRVRLTVCLVLCLSSYLCMSLWPFASVCLPLSLSSSLSVLPSVSLSTSHFLCLPLCLLHSFSVFQFVYPSAFLLYVCLPLCLSSPLFGDLSLYVFCLFCLCLSPYVSCFLVFIFLCISLFLLSS